MVRLSCVLLALSLLSGCGAAKGPAIRIGQELDRPSERNIAPPTRTPTPSLIPETRQAPIIRNYRKLDEGVDWWFIGTPTDIGVEEFTTHSHGGASIVHGRGRPQPVTAARVTEYLTTVDATKPFASPPFVQLRYDHDGEFAGLVFRAVQILNSALPDDFQIGMDANTYASSIGPPPGGVIRVERSAKSSWGREWIEPLDLTNYIGVAVRLHDVDSRYGSQVFIDTNLHGEELQLRMLVHEILHTLGFAGHFDHPSVSVMASVFAADPGGVGATIMFPIDLWGLREFYDPESFGKWREQGYNSREIAGCVDSIVCFGVTRLIGDPDPWASNRGSHRSTSWWQTQHSRAP